MGTFLIRYYESDAELAEEVDMLRADPAWVADHEDETPEEFVAGYAPSWVAGPLSTIGTDSPLEDGALRLPSEAEARAWIAAHGEGPGEYEVVDATSHM